MIVKGRSQAYRHRRPLGHSRTPPEGPPAVPRDAASLILVRSAGRDGDEPEVLLGRRSRRARFIPDAYVFPGGRVDGADLAARPATELDPDSERRLATRGNRNRARALAMAAVRETFEETGLLIAGTGEVGAEDHETWSELARRGVAPDLARLTYLGRAITSPYSPICFHARFFFARAEHAAGTLGGSGELSDLHWRPVRDAITELPIIDVTEFMLEEILRLWPAPEARDATPVFAYRRDRPFVRYD